MTCYYFKTERICNKRRRNYGFDYQEKGQLFHRGVLWLRPKRQADSPHRKFHALRHTSATLLLSNGTNIKNVASRLGHTQLKTTNRYVHAVDQAERQAANTLELILGGTRKTGKIKK